ncbi:unnamed protein product [Polarella glacialis]|uniref:Polymerase nucleotidyl transferase domain-containing protein n=1 Tax=Polarella glacialis TaxID=89957 RepID=A0A813L643_POLGL|nr:unnamed protein product [Polarella glacialis]
MRSVLRRKLCGLILWAALICVPSQLCHCPVSLHLFAGRKTSGQQASGRQCASARRARKYQVLDCRSAALALIHDKLTKLLPASLKRDPLAGNADLFSRRFVTVVQREKRLIGPTGACWESLNSACREALGTDLVLKQVGSYFQSTGSKPSGSDIDIRVSRQRSKISFNDNDKELLKNHLERLPFICGPGGQESVEIGKLSVKCAIYDADINEILDVDIVPLPQTRYAAECEDFPVLRGGPQRFENDAEVHRFFLHHRSARLAVSSLKLLLEKPRPPGIVLEAVVWIVARDRGLIPSSNVTAIEVTALFLETLSELAEPDQSSTEQIRSFARACRIADNSMNSLLQSARQQIQRGLWFQKFKGLLENPFGFTSNTKNEEFKHPQRHCVHLPGNHLVREGKFKYKCIWCQDYNRGVGSQMTDSCKLCGEVQIRHRQYERIRKEVEESEKLNKPYDGPSFTLRGQWLEAKPASMQQGIRSRAQLERRSEKL